MMDAMRFEMDASPSYACIYAYIAYCKLDRLAVVIKLKLLLQVSICILVFQADMLSQRLARAGVIVNQNKQFCLRARREIFDHLELHPTSAHISYVE